MLTKRENGAEMDIEVVARRENGAEIEAEAVYTRKNGAEEEVWSAIKWLEELAYSLSSNVDCGYATMGGGTVWSMTSYGEGSASGSVTYYLEGDFSNPHITFGYDGMFIATLSSGKEQYAKACNIEIYSRTKSGTTDYKTACSVGNSSGPTDGTYETTLSGEYDRIGIRITMQSWGDSFEYQIYDINISQIRIDGKECLPSADCVRN